MGSARPSRDAGRGAALAPAACGRHAQPRGGELHLHRGPARHPVVRATKCEGASGGGRRLAVDLGVPPGRLGGGGERADGAGPAEPVPPRPPVPGREARRGGGPGPPGSPAPARSQKLEWHTAADSGLLTPVVCSRRTLGGKHLGCVARPRTPRSRRARTGSGRSSGTRSSARPSRAAPRPASPSGRAVREERKGRKEKGRVVRRCLTFAVQRLRARAEAPGRPSRSSGSRAARAS